MCLNFLRPGHRTVTYRSMKYRSCQGNHNTKLHFKKKIEEKVIDKVNQHDDEEETKQALTIQEKQKSAGGKILYYQRQ